MYCIVRDPFKIPHLIILKCEFTIYYYNLPLPQRVCMPTPFFLGWNRSKKGEGKTKEAHNHPAGDSKQCSRHYRYE